MRCTVPGGKRKAAPGPTTSLVEHGLPHRADLDLRAARLEVPGLVLHAVELERQRLAGANEQHLAGVVVGARPEQLVPPRLVEALRLERERRQAVQVGRDAVARHPTSLSPCMAGAW